MIKHNSKEPIIYVIIVTYNGSNYIEKCLNSVFNSNIVTNVVIVDNQSTDNTVDIITKGFPNVELMVSPLNLGFGKANNIAIKYAFEKGADYFFLLNQDAFVSTDSIRCLYDGLKENVKFDLLSPIQLNGSGNKLDNLWTKHLSKSLFIGELLYDFMLKSQKSSIYQIDFINAAAWMMSRKCIEIVGLFHPYFEHYGEDVEYIARLQRKNLKVGLMLDSIIFHDRLQTQNDYIFNDRKIFMIEKAKILNKYFRSNPGLFINFLSAMLNCLFVNGWKLKIRLFYFAIKSFFVFLLYPKNVNSKSSLFSDNTPTFDKVSFPQS